MGSWRDGWRRKRPVKMDIGVDKPIPRTEGLMTLGTYEKSCKVVLSYGETGGLEVPVERPYVPWSVGSCLRPKDSRLEPELGPEDFIRIAGTDKLQAEELIRCELDPWYWRVNYVWTNDEHWVEKGCGGAWQRWPPKRHLQLYTDVLFVERLTAWPKARQQMVTWLVATQMLGDALFTGGRLYMIQSKREDDAQKVLARVRGVYERMRLAAPWLGPKMTGANDGELRFANGSIIMAVPQGAHYVQGHTPAWWFADEAQLQEQIEEAFYQALPACERITLVGSADNGWFFQTLLADALGGLRQNADSTGRTGL